MCSTIHVAARQNVPQIITHRAALWFHEGRAAGSECSPCVDGYPARAEAVAAEAVVAEAAVTARHAVAASFR